ncbi:MAG: putative Ig domain-containing protein [Acidobacteriota bacterium]
MVTLTYGPINVPVDGNPANNFLLITIAAIVCDTPSNMGMPDNQTTLTNSATAQIGNAQPPVCIATSNRTTIKVVEPKMTITKTFTPPTAKEGDMVSIKLTVMNTGLSDAYNVIVEDPIPLWLFDNATITTDCAVPSGFTFSKPVVGTDSVVTFTGGNIPKGSSVIFCFKGTIKRRCQDGMFNNLAKIKQAWTLPPPDCAPDCTRPSGLLDNTQGRDESVGVVGEAKLTITPAMDCSCYGVMDPLGIIRPPAYNNMVEWLKFDEATGDPANDSSLFSNNGTLMPASPNGPMHVSGLVGGALMFDGVNDSVVVPDDTKLDFGTGNFTIDAWINPDPVSVSATSGVRTILDKRQFGVGFSAPGYKLFLFNGRLALQLNDGNFFNFIAPVATALSPNIWTHVTAVATRTATTTTATLYVNGVNIHTQATAVITGSLDNASPLYIGRGVPTDGDYFTGKIDEVEMFNLALDATTVAGIANAGSIGKCLPLSPTDCCSRKPQLPDFPGVPEATYGTFTGQVAFLTCYSSDGQGMGANGPVLAAVNLKDQATAPIDMNWTTTSVLPPPTMIYHHPAWTRAQLGDVFGLTLDNIGNTYVAASTVYGYVSSTTTAHVGSLGGGTGGIYRIANGTGTPSVFVGTDNVATWGSNNLLPNTGPGLGNIHYDCAHDRFYASNFEDGMIYRIRNVAGVGQVIDRWDHGANLPTATVTLNPLSNPVTNPLLTAAEHVAINDSPVPGFTQLGRRVWAVQSFRGRLYYSVWQRDFQNQMPPLPPPDSTPNNPNAPYNEIWSVGLDPFTGAFVGPANREIRVPHLPITGTTSAPVSDISFGPTGNMLLGERTMYGDAKASAELSIFWAHQSRVLEYQLSGTGAWVDSGNFFETGNSSGNSHANSSGGVDYDYGANGRVWASVDAMHLGTYSPPNIYTDYLYGLQGMPLTGTGLGVGLTTPGNGGTRNSILIDLDGKTMFNDRFVKNQIGDVEIPCSTDPCLGVNIAIGPAMLPPVTAGQDYTSPQFTASGGTPGYTFSATGLPPMLTMSAGGVISGNPMQTGSFTITVKVTDANGCMGTKTYTLTVVCATDIVITPAALPNGMIGMAYSQHLTATGGCGTFTYSVIGGILPPGLSLSSAGVLSGTPTTCCDFPFTVKATDKCGCSQTMMYTVIIDGVATAMTGLFNTGVDNSNVVLANGATDTHYSLMKPDTTFDTTKVLAPPIFSVPWLANSATSKWIGPASPPNPMDGAYTYRTTFELPSCTLLTAVINGNWAVDDTATMKLNGVVVASLPTQLATNYTVFHPFTISSGFQSGTNELLITVNKLPNPAAQPLGLRIEMTGSAKCCPCQLAMGPDFLSVGSVGMGYNQTLLPYGGIPPYTFTLLSGNLPPGVTFTNGELSGTPSTPGSYTFTVKLTDATGCMTTRIYTIFIGCQVITFDPSTFRAGIVGVAYNQALTQTGGAGTVSYSRTSGLLPTGLELSAGGVLSGTPTTPGAFSFTLQATDANSCTATRAYSMETVCRIISLAPQTLPGGNVGVGYNQSLSATGSAAPYAFTVIGGVLPAGLTLSSAGVLAGTPTGAGNYGFTVKATDANGCSGVQFYSVVVCGTIAISPATLPNGFLGTAYNQTFSQPDIITLTTWSLSAGNLPTGLTLDPGTGVLSGTPTVFGNFNFTIKATDINGCMGTQGYSLTIICQTATVNPATIPNGFVGTAYNQTLTATGGATPYTFTISGGAAPGGLNLSSGGVLSGTPTTQGTFTFTVKATDAVGCMGTRSYTVVISGNGLVFYPLPRPVRIVDTRAGQGNCDNIETPITGGTSLTTLARLTCEGITIPATAQAVVGNLTVINQTAQTGFLTIYPDGQPLPLAANMVYEPGGILSNSFTVGLSTDGKFNVFGERTIDVIMDISGYYAPPQPAGLYYHPLSKPIRMLDTRPNSGNCDSVSTPISAGTSITTLARVSCEGLTIPTAAQAIVGNATVINGSGQVGYLTIYPNGVPVPLAANMVYFPGQILSNAFTVSLNANGEFNIFGERTIDMVVDVAGYFSAEANDVNGAGLLFTPLVRPLRILDTRASQGNCDSISTPIPAGTSIAVPARITCESITIPAAAQTVIGTVTVINPNPVAGYLTMYADGVPQPLAANMVYFPGQLLSNAFAVGLNTATGQFRIFGERTIEVIVDVSGFFAP